jgi:HEAT repeat protein
VVFPLAINGKVDVESKRFGGYVTEDNIEQLIAQLESEDLAIRYHAAFELLKQGRSEGIATLVEFVNKRHFQYLDSYAVVDQLAFVDDERVVDALIDLLDLSAHVVDNALRSLVTIGSERSIAAVFDMLMTPSPWRGWGTAGLLAEYEDRFVPRLLEASHHEHPLMRARSIYALGLIAASQEDTAIEDRLIAALEDDDGKVRERAAWGLARLSSDSAHEALLTVLESEDVVVAQWAAEGLYRDGLQVEKSFSILVETLSHEQWIVQRNAIDALKRIGDKQAVVPLIDRLQNDKRPGIRSFAAAALAAFDDTQAIQSLRDGLNDEDEMVRTACAKALSELVGTDILPEDGHV